MENIQGIIPAISTPVTENEEPDKTALGRLVNRACEAGVHGIFAMGSMGGYGFFDRDQRKLVGQIVVKEVDGRVPVFFGVSETGTKKVCKNIEVAAEIGADAAVACLPYYNTLNQEQIVLFYKEIAENSLLPVYLYNLPSVCGISMTLETIEELSKIETIKGIKDSSCDFSFFLDLVRTFECRDDFVVYAGDEKGIAQSLLSGADGSVVGTADLAPDRAVAIYDAVRAGDVRKAIELQKEWTELWQIHRMGDVFGAHNYALSLVGIGDGCVMSPCRELEPSERERVREILKKAELI